MEKLTELLERVKASTWPDRALDAEIGSMFRYHPYGRDHWLNRSPEISFVPTSGGRMAIMVPGEESPRDDWASPHYTASVDVALDLVEYKLPGKSCEILKLAIEAWEHDGAYRNQGAKIKDLPRFVVAALLSTLSSEDES